MTAEAGRWVELDLEPYSTDVVVNCDTCGARIPRRYWDDRTGRRYCAPTCVELGARVLSLRERHGSASRPFRAPAATNTPHGISQAGA